MSAQDWKLLFIGGTTTSGKSTLAAHLGQHFRTEVLEADLFNMVLERAALSGAEHPSMRAFRDPAVWTLSASELSERLVHYASFVCDTLEVVVAHRLETDRPAIIEGCWLLPNFVTQRDYTSAGRSGRFSRLPLSARRSLFVVESNVERLEHRLEERYGAGWSASNPGNVAMNHAYGFEVKRQAESLGLPVLEPTPFETLFERALSILEP